MGSQAKLDGIAGPESQGKDDPDLVSIFSRIFRRNKKSESKVKEFDPGVKGNASERLLDHGSSYGDIYANDKALTVMRDREKKFPVGSIIIREKWSRSLTEPEKGSRW